MFVTEGLLKAPRSPLTDDLIQINSLTFSSLYPVSPEVQQQHHCQDTPPSVAITLITLQELNKDVVSTWCVVQSGDTSATFPSWSQVNGSNVFLPDAYIQSHSFLMMSDSSDSKFTCLLLDFMRAVFGCTHGSAPRPRYTTKHFIITPHWSPFFSNFSLKRRGNAASAHCAHQGLNWCGRFLVQPMPWYLCLLSSRIWGLKQKKIYNSTESCYKGYKHWTMSNNLKVCSTGKQNSKEGESIAKKEK